MRAAIKLGDVEKVRNLFPHSSFPTDSLLAMAVQDYNTASKHKGHEQIVDFLISKGATPRLNMLCEAARTGSQALVDRLVSAGAELDIFACAAIGDLARMKRLLKRDPNLAKSKTPLETHCYQGFTPLHLCCMTALGRQSPSNERQFLEVGMLLVECGAEINASATFYRSLAVTPLDMAAHTGGNIALIEFLIDKGAVISSFAFAEALGHRGRNADKGFALADLFLRHGFKIDAKAKQGTVLHGAANSGSVDAVRWLLDRGANVNARGRMGRTPLHLAMERNSSTRIGELLLERGAELEARDDLGMTPLDVARDHGKTKLAEWLKNREKG